MNNENNTQIMVEKVSLIYKRIVLGIIIAILFAFTLIDTFILKQTIVARNYVDTVAIFTERKEIDDSEIFDDCIYTFEDKNGMQQEIVIDVSKNEEPENEIRIKYDPNNPQKYYEEGGILNKSGLIWYFVKIIGLVLLTILFFNKKLLNKINISFG